MILIISTCKDKLSEEEFVKPIANIVGAYEIKHYNDVGYVDNYDKIIICGTALEDNEFLKDLNKFNWLKNTDKDVLGICSGMQIIALKFGAKIIKQKEMGMVKIKYKKNNRLFSKDIEVYELHNNGLENLDNFNILAETNSIQSIKHKEKPFYGIMFHPEVRNEEIIKNFISLK